MRGEEIYGITGRLSAAEDRDMFDVSVMEQGIRISGQIGGVDDWTLKYRHAPQTY